MRKGGVVVEDKVCCVCSRRRGGDDGGGDVVVGESFFRMNPVLLMDQLGGRVKNIGFRGEHNDRVTGREDRF